MKRAIYVGEYTIIHHYVGEYIVITSLRYGMTGTMKKEDDTYCTFFEDGGNRCGCLLNLKDMYIPNRR
jgi:hypothetical protein